MTNKNFNQTGFNVFLELKMRKSSSEDYISVESAPSSKFHKIGISNEGYPLFFVKCNDLNNAIDINLELISVLFSKDCNIKEGPNISNNKFAIVLLKTINTDLQRYFTDVFSIILKKINELPSEMELNSEVRKVIDLFSLITKPALKTVQGLWSELLVIEKSLDPAYLINSWHISPNDKYDFNDSKDKIEVKSTNKAIRIHRFSLNQLNNNPGSGLLIISICVIETGNGVSIFDLKESISNKINNLDLEIKLNEIIFNTLRSEFKNANSIFFDYQLGCDSLLAYDVNDIPKINLNSIPQGVLNVKFDVDFTNLFDVVKKGYDLNKSLLFSAIQI